MHKNLTFTRPLALRYQLPRVLTGVAGCCYLFAAIFLLFAPRWFFTTIAPFAPFNRHFLGDAGSFLLPIAVGLIFVAFKPYKYQAVLLLGLWSSILHTANHVYDDIFVYGASLNHMLQDALPNALLSTLLISAYVLFRANAVNAKEE